MSNPKKPGKARQSSAPAAAPAAVPPDGSPLTWQREVDLLRQHLEATGVINDQAQRQRQRDELARHLATRPAAELAMELATLFEHMEFTDKFRAWFLGVEDRYQANSRSFQTHLSKLELQYHLAEAPKLIGAKGGARARFAPVREFAIESARALLNERGKRPSRSQVAAKILPAVVAEAERIGRPLKEGNSLRTVDGWLRDALPAEVFADRAGGTSTA